MNEAINQASQTSVLGAEHEITAPARLEGQSNSVVIFNWLAVNRYLWMLAPPHDVTLERIVGLRARLHLGFKLIEWRRDPTHSEEHEALAVPEQAVRVASFARLERLIKVHFFDPGDSDNA